MPEIDRPENMPWFILDFKLQEVIIIFLFELDVDIHNILCI
jgi:hypothetical protein